MKIEYKGPVGKVFGERGLDPLVCYEVTNKSPFATRETTIEIFAYPSDMRKFEDGALIQDAFPYLTADQREFMITGFTPEEWEEMFG